MAGLLVLASSGEFSLTASTARSALQIKAPTNQRLIIRKLSVFGKSAAGGTDTPTKIRMTRSTASFGTFGSALTSKLDPSDGETLQGTYGNVATAEPTAGSLTDGGMYWEVNPQTGLIDDLPIDKWIEVPGGQSVQFEFTNVATPTHVINAVVEE